MLKKNILIMKKNSNHKSTESSAAPKVRTEKDPDDLIHSQEQEESSITGNEDPDDVVHQHYKPKSDKIKEERLEDPDDLVHGYPEDED
jgi:hypothetical protein